MNSRQIYSKWLIEDEDVGYEAVHQHQFMLNIKQKQNISIQTLQEMVFK
jgi:hypothetical protein